MCDVVVVVVVIAVAAAVSFPTEVYRQPSLYRHWLQRRHNVLVTLGLVWVFLYKNLYNGVKKTFRKMKQAFVRAKLGF